MKRVFWLLPLFILPVLALGLLAWSLAEQAEDQALTSQRRQHEQMVRTCEAAFKNKATVLAEELRQWADRLRMDAPVVPPPARGQTWTLVFDADGRWWYPSIYNTTRRAAVSAGPSGTDSRWTDQLAEAARQEQANPSTELAAEQYAALDREDAPRTIRATAVLGLARCNRRMGRASQANRLYRRAMTDFAETFDETGTNFGAEAGAAWFKFAQGSGDSALAVQVWREYTDALLAESFPMPWALAVSHLTNALAQVPIAADAPEDVDRRQRLRLTIDQVEQMGQATAALPVAGMSDLPCLLQRDDLLLLARRVSSLQTTTVVVAALSMDWAHRSLIGPLLEDPIKGGTCRLCIRDTTSHRIIAGQEIPPGPIGPAEASLLDWGLPWTIAAGFADLPAMQAQAAQRRMLLTGSIAGLVVLIGAGTIIAFRMVRREMELSQLKSDFVDNVSHELRTPVTSIKLFSQMLGTGQVTDPDRQREYHRLLASESDRLMRMVENMLDFSRIVAGRIRLRPEFVDVSEYLDELYRHLQIQARPTGHRIHLHLGRDLPCCMLDRDSVARAIANLVSNAIKYSAKDREITLTAQRRDGMLSIMVRDRGVGIPPEDLPHIFDRFYRARHGDTDHIQGTGLGLTIVKDTVQRHGGRVRVESRLSEGTVVELLLPIQTKVEGT